MVRLVLPLLLLLLALLPASASAQPGWHQAVVFYGSGWGSCIAYLEDELYPVLRAAGVQDIQARDYQVDWQARRDMTELNQRLGIPLGLQEHLVTVVDDRVLIEGHVPGPLVGEALASEVALPPRLLLYRQGMHEEGKTYQVWDFRGKVREYRLGAPISDYLNGLEQGKNAPGDAPASTSSSLAALLPLVLVNGLIDGVNPCAFAVLVYLVAFLFTIRRVRADILKLGIIYVAAIYLTYFALGLGLLGAFRIPGEPHLIARIGAYLMMALGLVHLKDYFFPNLPITLSMPKMSWESVKGWINKATLPSTVVVGILVGLCTLPCSGGIYVATLGLLAAKTTFAVGLAYLALYNLAYIAPLAVILAGTTNRPVAKSLASWERSHARQGHLVFGAAMIALGIVILVWAL